MGALSWRGAALHPTRTSGRELLHRELQRQAQRRVSQPALVPLARWYDAALGRFISEDPAGLTGGINPYVFAGDDPINGRDPSGLLQEAPSPTQIYCAKIGGNYAAFSDREVCIGSNGINQLTPVNVSGRADGSDGEPADVPSSSLTLTLRSVGGSYQSARRKASDRTGVNACLPELALHSPD